MTDLESRNLLKQRLAALDATAVEYAAGRDSMYAFVIDGDGISGAVAASRRADVDLPGARAGRERDHEQRAGPEHRRGITHYAQAFSPLRHDRAC